MHLRHLFAAVLALVVILGVLDVAGLYAFDELAIVGYLLTYFIAATVLFILSWIGLAKDAGWLRGFDAASMTLSLGSVLLSFVHFAAYTGH